MAGLTSGGATGLLLFFLLVAWSHVFSVFPNLPNMKATEQDSLFASICIMLVAKEVHYVSEVGAHHLVHCKGQTHHEGKGVTKEILQGPHQKHQEQHIEEIYTQQNLIK